MGVDLYHLLLGQEHRRRCSVWSVIATISSNKEWSVLWMFVDRQEKGHRCQGSSKRWWMSFGGIGKET
ncbi:hypothetical protein GUJ93_ZPchr0008g13694 [Zizania palustris]|uniref:Uncharacterized protein n=1 Tax=Zizania palustris TaxID=103762 RepID=A0A8J5RGC6_ZIZPA|nr:hypothetical protein GUJ93_ZPchr0008g13694 [Zizania palustris]